MVNTNYKAMHSLTLYIKHWKLVVQSCSMYWPLRQVIF